MVAAALVPAALLLLLARPAEAAVATNALFSDGMILQTQLEAPLSPLTTLHGTAAPGEKVTLTGSAGFPGSPLHTAADSSGAWSLTLKPDTAATPAGPFVLTLTGSAGGAPVVAKDVHFGDVYFCSGQSNMEKTVSYDFNGTAEIAAAIPGSPGGPPPTCADPTPHSPLPTLPLILQPAHAGCTCSSTRR